MWRFIVTFIAAALLTSVAWAAVAPRAGFVEDLGMIGLGFLGIFLLGNEVFLRALIPDKQEIDDVRWLLESFPGWKKALLVIGMFAGTVGASLFFIIEKKLESIWVAWIPIGVFCVSYMILQYLVPSIASKHNSEVAISTDTQSVSHTAELEIKNE